ncbi:MAG: NTP transferase domain-containing protein [Bacteroidales bacterium]|nr:NTP transferase domain-containing protein [Lentimicrobiaceae bacterium]MDD5693697.1 NTP transferase domain-containing protein [Bacteroidales bacterium]
MMLVTTGRQGEGKTSWLIRLSHLLLREFIQVGGICSLGTWADGQRDRFHVMDVENNQRSLLCNRRNSGRDIAFHHFYFKHTGLDFGLNALHKVCHTHPDVLMIDEVGGLELENQGWAPFLEILPELPVGIIVMAVRESLVERVVNRWHLTGTQVIRISETSPESLMPAIRRELEIYDRNHKPAATGIILAGGKSSRFGTDKGNVMFRDQPLISIAIERFKRICQTILISTNSDLYQNLGYPVIPDLVNDCGPMMGIYSCLIQSPTQVNLVASVDTPLVPVGLYRALISMKENARIVVPDHGRAKYEPMIGLYDREITGDMKRLMERNIYTLPLLYKEVPFKGMPVGKDYPFSNPLIFANINTPDDLTSLEAHDVLTGNTDE